MSIHDTLGRPLRDLRISVTDRCNFRCTYCMPREVFGPDYQFLDRQELLSYEEIARLARIFARLGVEKIRVTGGEPLIRKDVERMISLISNINGISDITLTTNGSLLRRKAKGLAEAGLRRVTVSLDSLDDNVFSEMNDSGVPVATVLEGIDAAAAAGLSPIKVNAVIQRGVNDQTMVDLARHFHGTGHILRFIEFMDVGNTNDWRLDEVVTAKEMTERIDAELPIEPLEPNYVGEVARRWRYRDGGGELGFITSISQSFCGECTRARLSPEGQLFTCLFSGTGFDLRELVRSDVSNSVIESAIGEVWSRRTDRYSEIRSEATTDLPRVEMSRIGG